MNNNTKMCEHMNQIFFFFFFLTMSYNAQPKVVVIVVVKPNYLALTPPNISIVLYLMVLKIAMWVKYQL